MNLNELKPHAGAHKPGKNKRGYSKGKTQGRGHKGQKSRSGGSVNAFREGGQMPLYRRLPKFGFKSRVSQHTISLPLRVLNQLTDDQAKEVTLAVLQGENMINHQVKRVKLYLCGEVSKSFHLKGISATKGVVEAITKQKGTVE